MRVSRTQGLLLVAGILTYLLMGALIFELLEKDHYLKMEDAMFQLKEDFFLNYTSLSQEEVELVIQVRHYFSKTERDDHGMTPKVKRSETLGWPLGEERAGLIHKNVPCECIEIWLAVSGDNQRRGYSYCWNIQTEPCLQLQRLVKYAQKGVEPIGRHDDEGRAGWDFSTSFFFMATVLTTIGYGNLCPQTKEGQLFCIIFALFGIPFNLLCFNYIGTSISRFFESCTEKVYGKGRKKSARYIFVFVVLGILMFLILPAFFFQWMEGWAYYEAIYFTFVTLSTIGFGDYIIGIKQDRTYFPGYRMLGAAWIVVGLAWIAVLFQRVSSFLAPVDPKPSSPKKSKR
uniref:potassium channel subfamily K member 9-like n=1 Tax=Podarcis muralis TaxID=64176 RepID=UPI0010A09BD5|nr:potassium channel subfamily K member 9-like [Podarcis muralis]